MKDAYELAEKLDGEKVYVIGGGQLYAAALPWTQYLDLTEIFARADQVDTYFPDYHDFKALDAESHETEDGIKYGGFCITRLHIMIPDTDQSAGIIITKRHATR